MLPFKFKQFTVAQDKCAMKIGTDAVLLGAWISLKNKPFSILDIGAGTGVIALQLAQRSFAEQIDAIEIEENAFQQCVSNFENSDWSDRLFCYHASLNDLVMELVEQEDEKYDLIVSNPPFYSEDYQTKSNARNKARFTSFLSFESLLLATSKLLSKYGTASFIIPFHEQANFINIAKNNNLYLTRICNVKGTTQSDFKRTLLEFSFRKAAIENTELSIEVERHQYTKDYIDLVKDFYLKM